MPEANPLKSSLSQVLAGIRVGIMPTKVLATYHTGIDCKKNNGAGERIRSKILFSKHKTQTRLWVTRNPSGIRTR